MTALTIACPDITQAAALADLVETEARWVNVPVAVLADSATARLAGLIAKQKAFDIFHSQQVAYNQQFRPAYHGQRPVTTAARLALWCRNMAELFRRTGRAECPINVLEQAHRCADRLGHRLNREIVRRPAAVTTTADVIDGLGAIAAWCEGLAPVDGDGLGRATVQAPRA